MDIKIFPSKLDGVVEAVSNKAHAWRVFLASILSKDKTEIYLKTPFEEIKNLISILKSLSYAVSQTDCDYTVAPCELDKKAVEIDVGDNAVSLKFIAPVLCALGVNFKASLGEKLRKKIKPDDFYCIKGVEPVKRGANISFIGKLIAGEYNAKDISSSYLLSAIMMSLAIVDGNSKIVCDNDIKNKIYFKQTLAVMKDFGVDVELVDDGVLIKGGQKYIAKSKMVVEGDYYASAFIMGANVFGNRVRITGLNPESVQTDKKIRDYLLSFNAKGTTLDLTNNQDLVYILAVVSCFAFSNTTIKGINLTGKEGETLNAFVSVLNKLGATLSIENEQLKIEGKAGLKGGAMVDSFGDYRIAMAISLAGTVADEPITVLSAHAVNKIYPNFFNDFKTLGGICQAF
ncbi:MAG: hypothetical protein IJY57_04625 [Clostridia bacterium]|nr:hypothetical protein [Clostridia bacterium]